MVELVARKHTKLFGNVLKFRVNIFNRFGPVSYTHLFIISKIIILYILIKLHKLHLIKQDILKLNSQKVRHTSCAVSYTHLDVYKRQGWKIMVPDAMVEDLTWMCHESLAHAGPYKCCLLYTSRCV